MVLAALSGPLLAGCVQTQWQGSGYGPTQTLRTADQTMDMELTDRVHRLARLAQLQGMSPPQVEEVVLPADRVANAARPIPIIRVTFDERDFFAPGSASPRPEAAQALRIMADSLQRDVPDVRVTVLGHTDASGTEQANAALSQTRAQTVVQSLVASGANPGQLSAVAIGATQPVAPNDTAVGRARNRRVEFLISPSEQANLAIVSLRPVNAAFLSLGGGPARSAHAQVTVLKPRYAGPADFSEAPAASPRGAVTLAANGLALSVGDDTGSPVASELVRVTAGPHEDGPTLGDSGSPVGPIAASFKPD